MAAGAVNTARQLGFTFGVAVVGSVFAGRLASHLAAAGHRSGALAQAVAGGQARAVLGHTPAAGRASVEAAVRAASAYGLHVGLLVAGGLGLVGGIVARAALKRHPAAGPAAGQVLPSRPCRSRGRGSDLRRDVSGRLAGALYKHPGSQAAARAATPGYRLIRPGFSGYGIDVDTPRFGGAQFAAWPAGRGGQSAGCC
jgi:hypothetical protein